MKLFLILALTLGLSASAYSASHGLSAARHKDETYEAAKERNALTRVFQFQQGSETEPFIVTSADYAKKPLNEVNLSKIPEVASYEILVKHFELIRDKRFIKMQDKPDFLRRPSWLFPDDGCFARAELAKNELEAIHFTAPKKIFVFGALYAASKNTPTGYVDWWYHVAVTYRVGAQAYVFDPAIEPARPLKLEEWDFLVGGTKTSVQYSVCAKDTYDPYYDCSKPRVNPAEASLHDQKAFLPAEWSRLILLNRNPVAELGDLPPWAAPSPKP